MESQIEVLDPVQAESATALALYDPIEAGLAELREAGTEAFDVKTTAGNKAAREFVQRCVGTRTATEEAYTNWNRPVLAWQKRNRDKRDEIVAAVKAIEQPIKELVDAEQKRKDEEKAAREVAERQRVAIHQDRINAIRHIAMAAAGQRVSVIELAIADLECTDVSAESFEEFSTAAARAQEETLAKLREMLAAAAAHEAEQARIAAEREELARLRAEQAKREAEEAARLAAERENQEAELKARREAQEKEFAELRAKQVEADRVANEQRQAQERALADQRAELRRQQDAIDAQRREAERMAQEKADAEAAEARRKQEEADEAARIEAARIQSEKDAQEAEKQRRARIQFETVGPHPGEILQVLASHYGVTKDAAQGWLNRHSWAQMEKAA